MSEPQYTQIADLKPAMRNLNLRFIVIDVTKPTRTKEGQEVCTVRIADRSGAVNLTIWNELCTLLEPSDICRLHNAYTNVWKGALTVQTGKQGELRRIGQFNLAFSDSPDLSTVVYADWEPAQGAGSASVSKAPNATSNGTFANANRYERHDSGSQSSAANHHSSGRAENSHRERPPSAVGDAASLPAAPGGAKAANSGVSASPANAAPSLNAFRQAFIQPGSGTSPSSVNPPRAAASPTPLAAPNRAGPQAAAAGNHKSANDAARKHVYREIDMFASAPPEKKVRVGDAQAQNSQSHKALAKLKETGGGVKTGLAQTQLEEQSLAPSASQSSASESTPARSCERAEASCGCTY